MMTLLRLLGIAAIAYAIYYFFIKKPVYTINQDYTVQIPYVTNPQQKTAALTAVAATTPVTIKTGDKISGERDITTNGYVVNLDAYGYPGKKATVPASIVTVSKPIWPLF